MYKDVTKLTEDQLDCLKCNLWFAEDGENFFYDYLPQEDKDIINNCGTWFDIPNEVIYRAYAGISFVDEDFSV